MKSSNLVTTSMLAEHLEDPDWIIIDCRFNFKFPKKGEKDYQEEHILGALYAHLNRDLAGPVEKGRSGRHPLPDPQTCVQTLCSRTQSRLWHTSATCQRTQSPVGCVAPRRPLCPEDAFLP